MLPHPSRRCTFELELPEGLISSIVCKMLLAVDLGLRSGLALYERGGRLLRFSSTNFGSVTRLKRAAYGVVAEVEALEHVYLEGDRALADVWSKVAEKRGATTTLVSAETWRSRLLYAREQRSGHDAKRHADHLARAVIAWSLVRRPSSLRHDAAEAILLGLYGVLDRGWLSELPHELQQRTRSQHEESRPFVTPTE